jgi:hypothetical protein
MRTGLSIESAHGHWHAACVACSASVNCCGVVAAETDRIDRDFSPAKRAVTGKLSAQMPGGSQI